MRHRPWPNGSASTANLAPRFGADRVLDQGARRHRPRERALDPVDDDVKVHRRPVSVVSAKARSGTDRAGLLAQKEEGNLPAYQLHSARPEPPSDRKPESIGVERNRTPRSGTSTLISTLTSHLSPCSMSCP